MAEAPAPRRNPPTRRFLLMAGGWLVVLGGATFALLSGLSDNAYLWLMILVLLAPVGGLFLVGAALPPAARRWIWYGGLVLLWIVGVVGLVLFGLALVILLLEASSGPAVFGSYLLGIVVLATSLYLIGLRPLRTPTSRTDSGLNG